MRLKDARPAATPSSSKPATSSSTPVRGDRPETDSERLRRRILTFAGAAVGLAAAGVWMLLTGRIEPDAKTDRLGVDVVALASGEFAAQPREVIEGADLKPGGRAVAGTLEIRNQTSRPATASFRAKPSIPDVGRTLQIRATATGRVVFDGDLDGLEHWAHLPVPLQPGGVQKLTVTARIKRASRPLHGLSQNVTVAIELRRSTDT